MSLYVVCPECRAQYSLPDLARGRKVRCKKCNGVFTAEDDLEVEDVVAVEEEVGVEEVEVVNLDAEELDLVVEEPARPRPSPIAAKPRPQPRRDAVRPVARPSRAVDALTVDEDDDDEDEEEPSRGSGAWVVVGLVAFGLLLIGGGITAAVMLKNDSSETSSDDLASAGPPTQPAVSPPGPPVAPPVTPPVTPPITPPSTPPITPPVTPPVTTPATPPAPRPGELSVEALEKVKRATVFLRITGPDGGESSGSGFFGAQDARNIVLTNAHVVGMLAPGSQPPRKVEVVVNSGQKDQRTLGARVLGVDRSSDLAVLDVGPVPDMPEPLNVKSAEGLRELERVYVFGFPLGERLGMEITVRDSTVSSLRRKEGVLHRLQVNGGMDEGNSGGPLVDALGDVVGVAVSGIPGRQINFAIPGDRVHVILKGRISEMGIDWPFVQDDRVGVPVTMKMIDPRQRISEVALEVWAGPQGEGTRPPADAKPADQPGDTPHEQVALRYDPVAGEAVGDVLLPPLGPGQAYWVRPTWKYKTGEQRWAAANVHKLTTQPLERKSANLTARFRTGAVYNLSLTVENRLSLGEGEGMELGTLKDEVTLREQTLRGGVRGATLKLNYVRAEREVISDGRARPSSLLREVQPFLNRFLLGVVFTDAYGNPTRNEVDAATLRGLPDPEKLEKLLEFHGPIQAAISTTAVPLPNKEVVPGERWRGERSLPIPLPERDRIGKVAMTYTYLGRRNRNGREEAVLDVRGEVQGKDKEAELGGSARGKVLVDLVSGQVSLADIQVTVELPVVLADLGGPAKETRVLATLAVVLKRGGL